MAHGENWNVATASESVSKCVCVVCGKQTVIFVFLPLRRWLFLMPSINSLRIGKCIIHRAKEDKENHDEMESIFSFKSKLKIRFKIGFEFQ